MQVTLRINLPDEAAQEGINALLKSWLCSEGITIVTDSGAFHAPVTYVKEN